MIHYTREFVYYDDNDEPTKDIQNSIYAKRTILDVSQKQKENGEWILWDNKNECEIPWNKKDGIVSSIKEYMKGLGYD